jgi:hypothetical protein
MEKQLKSLQSGQNPPKLKHDEKKKRNLPQTVSRGTEGLRILECGTDGKHVK